MKLKRQFDRRQIKASPQLLIEIIRTGGTFSVRLRNIDADDDEPADDCCPVLPGQPVRVKHMVAQRREALRAPGPDGLEVARRRVNSHVTIKSLGMPAPGVQSLDEAQEFFGVLRRKGLHAVSNKDEIRTNIDREPARIGVRIVLCYARIA